jgi:lactoylglutathione lyase
MRVALVSALLILSAAAAVEADPPRPKITGVAHIAIFVRDLDQAKTFCTGMLGLAQPFDLKNADNTIGMLFFRVNDRQFIEVSREREPNTDRLNHIAFEVEDAEAMRQYLKAKGIAVPDSVPKGRTGNLNFTIKDPEGHGVEFVQYTPESLHVKERAKPLPPEALSPDMRHIGILVGSLGQSMAFYGDILGFREIWRGSRDGKTLSWVNMQVPDGQDYVEFMLCDQLPGPTERGSQHHLCLVVSDIQKSAEVVRGRTAAAGYTRTLEVRTGINRKRQLNLFDVDGTRAELMEPVTIDGAPTPPSDAPPPRK